MNRITSHFAILLVLTGVSAPIGAQQQSSSEDALIQALEQFDRLQESRSNMDIQLAEPLLQIAEQYRARGRYADAHEAFDRGMQIVRVNNGLYSSQQLPYLEGKIENYADWGDWESARSLLEHLMWLHRTKTRYIDETLLEDLMDASRFHLRGISEDNLEFQAFHFRRALSANWLAVSAAERLWSRTDRRLVPMLFALLKQYHLQTVAINRGGRTGYDLRLIVPGTDWVRERSEMRLYHFETGARILNQLYDIYNMDGAVDEQALAMVQLYRADWQLIYSQDEQALASYQIAFDGLLAAGVPADMANQYFASPTVLPVDEFHDNLDDALVARSTQANLASRTDQELGSTLYFAEWSASFPYARSPLRAAEGKQVESSFALFSLSLSGLTEISRWLSSSPALEFGNLVDVTLLDSDRPEQAESMELRQRVNSLHFRPRLVDGMPTESSATLLYQQAAEPQLVGF